MVKLYTSDTVWDFAEVNCFVRLMDNFDNEIVNVWGSNTVWPPEFRFRNFNINVHIFILYSFETLANNFIIELYNNMIISLNDLRNIQSNSEVNYCFLFTDKSVSGPDIVDLNVFKRFNVNFFPNAQSHQVWSPVPTVLVAGFSCMCVVEWHGVCALTLGVMLLGRLNFYLKFVFSCFQVLVNVY